MADGNGAAPRDPYYNESDLRLRGMTGASGETPALAVTIEDDTEGEPPETVTYRENKDGTLSLKLSREGPDRASAGQHNANLAEYIDDAELFRIADELLDGINRDLDSRKEWLERRGSGIKHLALKVENPRSPSADADTAVEGQSVIRSPIMLDAVLRFQANARGELLPAGGPAKIRNDTISPPPVMPGMPPPAPDDSDYRAEGLEKLFNFYLTVTDKEYYPDTNRMFFMQGFGGSGFKKVYFDPVRRRPMSRAVDAADIIVSDDAVSLTDCGRVTHRIMMRPSMLRRMQLAGQYVEDDGRIPLAPSPPSPDAVQRAESDVSGISPESIRPQDYEYTIYECYCELDIKGFEHREKGRVSGLPLPYRVSIDKDSQKILEVRRNWRESDDRYLGRMPIVKYPFVEGLGFYGLGLLNIMGNATAAITTAWRLALDSAAFSSWPGFLYSETVGRQDTMSFRVGLGAGVRINTGGQPIGQNVMSLPYKDVTAGLVQVTTHIEDEARRVGGTPELMTGEGRADVPVGTTLAMLDQAVKVVDSVHKGMHIAQAEELSLLRDLFIEYPESLLCGNPRPGQWTREELIAALQNCNLSPQSDPNTPSHTIRVMKAVALVQFFQMGPDKFDFYAVARRVASMIGMGTIDELFSQGLPNQQPDPKHIETLRKMQADLQKAQLEKDKMQQEMMMNVMEGKLKILLEEMQLQNNREERASRMALEQEKQRTERMQLAQSALVHQEAIPAAQTFAQTWHGSQGGRVI